MGGAMAERISFLLESQCHERCLMSNPAESEQPGTALFCEISNLGRQVSIALPDLAWLGLVSGGKTFDSISNAAVHELQVIFDGRRTFMARKAEFI
jgi:hypothetical protein